MHTQHHLETDLAIKASYKEGHIIELTHFKLPHFLSPENRIHPLARDEIDQEGRSAQHV